MSKMMNKSLFDRYVEACNYPGRFDEPAIRAALEKYLTALGIHRGVVQLRRGWDLQDHPSLRMHVQKILDKIPNLDSQAALVARDARDSQAAQDSQVARAAQDARAARVARDAQAAQAALRRFAQWCLQRYYWYDLELSWLVTTAFGAKTDEVKGWSYPLMDAFLGGCWFLYFTADTLYWIAKPNVFTRRDNFNRRILHRVDGPAVESDIEDLFFLNGVFVPEWLVMTPAHKLNAKELTTRKELKENVEVRREFVRKIGIERCLNVLGWKKLSIVGTYELGETMVGESPRRYLKMLNPSVNGVWHLEAVHPSCENVQEAINWRTYGDKSKQWQPFLLT